MWSLKGDSGLEMKVEGLCGGELVGESGGGGYEEDGELIDGGE